jgi:hypothetical protein
MRVATSSPPLKRLAHLLRIEQFLNSFRHHSSPAGGSRDGAEAPFRHRRHGGSSGGAPFAPALAAGETAKGWPIFDLDSLMICPTCYGDEAYCCGCGELMEAYGEDSYCDCCAAADQS